MTHDMVIGALARSTGVPAKTIRYYEETGLIPPAKRAPNGYRVYGERAIEQKIRDLQSLRATLRQLVDRCHGDARPDCPILDDLATHESKRKDPA